ncbi:helix-turn-helix transcriptional regulator [Granulicoccus sp. GXG6511]|uniref:helix-turn-helix transcriptional regulator n=1 Tax=Granulicoccus sp. GXG6511 TaxID=3381351 RepID=UPI003D7D3BD6
MSARVEETASDPFARRLREQCLTRAGIDVRFLSGMPAMRRATAQLEAMPASERLAVVTRFGPRATRPILSAAVTRIVVPPSATSGTARDQVDALGDGGAHIRVSPRAIRRLTVVNRSVALVDVTSAEGRAEREGVRILNADLIRSVVGHFEDLWSTAAPLNDSGPPTLDRFTARQRRILELLAQGMTDDMVSRELEVSTRSVRTEVAIIREVLGAASRFEAGMRYAEILDR